MNAHEEILPGNPEAVASFRDFMGKIYDCFWCITKKNKLKGRGPGINSSQSRNVGKIQLSMQLSHLSIFFENVWF